MFKRIYRITYLEEIYPKYREEYSHVGDANIEAMFAFTAIKKFKNLYGPNAVVMNVVKLKKVKKPIFIHGR